MSLKKDDIVELVEKTDNGWWLVKKNGVEGWTPNNYLVLVPPKPKATPTPPPPPPPPSQRKVPAPPQAITTTTPAVKPSVKSLAADSNAKPVSVFPGMGPSNGSATPWKKTHVQRDSTDNSPNSSRPNSSLANKPPLPVATKPKLGPPPIASKPNTSGGSSGPPKIPGKPPVPSTQRPTGASRPVPPKSGVKNPAAVGGQLDLAAAVSELSTFFTGQDLIYALCSWLREAREAQTREWMWCVVLQFAYSQLELNTPILF
jgi:myosin I